MGAGVPVVVTVADAQVVAAVYGLGQSGGRDGAGIRNRGDPADKIFWLTINDVIEKANDTESARVDVEWPAGQDYPNSVYVDGDKKIADDGDVGLGVDERVVADPAEDPLAALDEAGELHLRAEDPVDVHLVGRVAAAGVAAAVGGLELGASDDGAEDLGDGRCSHR